MLVNITQEQVSAFMRAWKCTEDTALEYFSMRDAGSPRVAALVACGLVEDAE